MDEVLSEATQGFCNHGGEDSSLPAIGQVGSQLMLGTNLQGVAGGGHRLLKGQVLEDIQGSWPAVAPGGNEDVSWTGLGG